MKFIRKQETVQRQPDAILTSDWHIREDTPECRVDDFMATQERKLKWLSDLQEKFQCPIFDGGDLFDHWKPTPYLLQWTIKRMPKNVWTVPGNHDLAQHNMELFDRSGLAVLDKSSAVVIPLNGAECTNLSKDKRIIVIRGHPWETVVHPTNPDDNSVHVLLTHEMTYLQKDVNPFLKGSSAERLANDYGKMGHSLVVSGHNHQSFQYKDEETGCLLVNPGCIMRQRAEEIDYTPRVALWYADTNSIEWIPIPVEKEAVTRLHLETKVEREDRIDSFVSRMKKDFEIELSFDRNMRSYLAKNRTHLEVIKLLDKAMEKE